MELSITNRYVYTSETFTVEDENGTEYIVHIKRDNLGALSYEATDDTGEEVDGDLFDDLITLCEANLGNYVY